MPVLVSESKVIDFPDQTTQVEGLVITENGLSLLKHEVDEQRRFHEIETIVLGGKQTLVKPEISFSTLDIIFRNNNALLDLTAAMRENVDSTGFKIEPKSGLEKDIVDSEVETITDFFGEMFPNTSVEEIRTDQREVLESTGNGFIEIIRNMFGDIVLGKQLDTLHMLLVKLDKPITKTVTVRRSGRDFPVEIQKAERRFFLDVRRHTVGHPSKLEGIFYKEFGVERDLNKETGDWAPKGSLPPEKRASEVLHLKVLPAIGYSSPRWIHKSPSILGSRSAEELNLSYFNRGGVPPFVMTVSGGVLAQESRKELVAALGGSPSSKLIGLVLSAIPTGGSIEKESPVKIDVHRFGAEQQKDSLFQDYDIRTQEKTRAAYRIPPIFLGEVQDHTRATAFVAYRMGEEQIFAPERKKFDRIINDTLMKAPEFFSGKYVFVSNPLPIRDPDLHARAVDNLWNAGAIEPVEYVDQINRAVGLEVKPREGLENMSVEDLVQSRPQPRLAAAQGGASTLTKSAETYNLVMEYVQFSGLAGDSYFNLEKKERVDQQIAELNPQDSHVFQLQLAEFMHSGAEIDTALADHLECCGASQKLVT